jgi:RNA polymerase sigma-70 factor (ECF subfamily)
MAGSFATTHWTRVLDARAADGPDGRAALEELCGAYWPALYAWLRARGRSEADAADLVQGYFAALFAREGLGKLEREGGRFRDWLLAGLRNHERDEHERGAAQKRGGGRLPLSFETHFDWRGETRRLELASSVATPEQAFERRWAEAVLERARERVARDLAGGDEGEWKALAPVLEGEPPDKRALAARGLSAVAIRVRVHRLRARLGQAVRDELTATLGPDSDTETELGALIEAISESPVELGGAADE